MREWLGSWGISLSDSDLAQAVLGLGLIPRAYRGVAMPEEIEGAVRKQLKKDRRQLLSWYLDALPTEASRWAARVPAERLAAVVRETLSDLPRVALDARSAIDVILIWRFLARNLSIVPCSAGHFPQFVSRRSSTETIQFRWPCRVGYFPGTPTELTASQLQSLDYWNGDIFKTVPITRRQCECDILVSSGLEPAQAIEDISSRSLHVGGAVADLVVVFLGGNIPDSLRVQDLDPLRRTVDASGLLLIPAMADSEEVILHRMVEGIAHNAPLDVVVADVTAGSGLLLADLRLIKAAQLESRLLATVQVMRASPRAGEMLMVDSGAADRLKIPAAASVGDVATHIEKHLARNEYVWIQESREASAYGHITRRMDEADEMRRTPRYLQAGVHPDSEPQVVVRGALRADTRYQVAVFVGGREPAYLSVEEAFPAMPPPEDGRAHRLTVVFSEPQLAPKPQVKHIELPPVGNSSVCRFALRTLPDSTVLNARISVLHRNRVLQTGQLRVPVGVSDVTPSFQLDAAPRTILNGLDDRLNFSSAFVLNDVDGASCVHAVSGDRAAVIDMDDDTVTGLVQVLNAAITEITERPRDFEGLRAPGSEKLLRKLAQKGASLRKYLMRHAMRGGPITAPTHVQVVSAKAGKVFPVEFLYEFEAPEQDARICANAELALQAGLANGGCPAGCPALRSDDGPIPTIQEHVICPLGFWGLRCVIERKAHRPSHGAIGGDYRLIAEPVGQIEGVLRPLERTVVGATDKANLHTANAVTDMVQRVRQVVTQVEVVNSWQDWIEAIERLSPTLLTLVVHQEKDEFGTPELDIGAPPRLLSDLVKPRHVAPGGQEVKPIALIVGCETAIADIDYENFALRFQDEGAVIVVSTIAKILGRQATPVTAELVEEMSKIAEPTPFAEVLRDIRRRLLLSGTPMVLALTALGDADWEITAGP